MIRSDEFTRRPYKYPPSRPRFFAAATSTTAVPMDENATVPPELFEGPGIDEHLCCVCLEVPLRPFVNASLACFLDEGAKPCRHIMCARCIARWTQEKGGKFTCPVCRTAASQWSVSAELMAAVAPRKVRCAKCSATMTAVRYTMHSCAAAPPVAAQSSEHVPVQLHHRLAMTESFPPRAVSAIIAPDGTGRIRLNNTVAPFNADFDADEVNVPISDGPRIGWPTPLPRVVVPGVTLQGSPPPSRAAPVPSELLPDPLRPRVLTTGIGDSPFSSEECTMCHRALTELKMHRGSNRSFCCFACDAGIFERRLRDEIARPTTSADGSVETSRRTSPWDRGVVVCTHDAGFDERMWYAESWTRDGRFLRYSEVDGGVAIDAFGPGSVAFGVIRTPVRCVMPSPNSCRVAISLGANIRHFSLAINNASITASELESVKNEPAQNMIWAPDDRKRARFSGKDVSVLSAGEGFTFFGDSDVMNVSFCPQGDGILIVFKSKLAFFPAVGKGIWAGIRETKSESYIAWAPTFAEPLVAIADERWIRSYRIYETAQWLDGRAVSTGSRWIPRGLAWLDAATLVCLQRDRRSFYRLVVYECGDREPREINVLEIPALLPFEDGGVLAVRIVWLAPDAKRIAMWCEGPVAKSRKIIVRDVLFTR